MSFSSFDVAMTTMTRLAMEKDTKLVSMAHALVDKRYGLVNDFRLTWVNGMTEREASLVWKPHASKWGKVLHLATTTVSTPSC